MIIKGSTATIVSDTAIPAGTVTTDEVTLTDPVGDVSTPAHTINGDRNLTFSQTFSIAGHYNAAFYAAISSVIWTENKSFLVSHYDVIGLIRSILGYNSTSPTDAQIEDFILPSFLCLIGTYAVDYDALSIEDALKFDTGLAYFIAAKIKPEFDVLYSQQDKSNLAAVQVGTDRVEFHRRFDYVDSDTFVKSLLDKAWEHLGCVSVISPTIDEVRDQELFVAAGNRRRIRRIVGISNTSVNPLYDIYADDRLTFDYTGNANAN